MKARTGQTIYEDIMSLDMDNNPVTAATFDIVMTKEDILFTGITTSISLVDDTRGIFSASWSADTTGDYQLYVKNITTNVIFISDTVSVRPDSEFDQSIYIGL